MKHTYHYILTLLLLLLVHQADAQIYSHESSKNNDGFSYTEHIIFIITPTFYEIQVVSGGGCEIFVLTQSYGIAKQFGDTLIMHNIMANYKMTALCTDTTLQIIQGYEYLKSMVFKSHGNAAKTNDLYYEGLYDNYMRYGTLYHKVANKKTKRYRFKKGIYGGYPQRYTDSNNQVSTKIMGHRIYFEKNTYTYMEDNLLLTKGTWHRAGNYILLHDLTLMSQFVLRLRDHNQVITKVFPSGPSRIWRRIE